MDNKINNDINAILIDSVNSNNFSDAMHLKTLSANNAEYRKYNFKLRLAINEYLSAMTEFFPLFDIALAVNIAQPHFHYESSKKRQSIVSELFPEVKAMLKIGKTVNVQRFARNNDVGKTGDAQFAFMQIVANVTSFIKFVLVPCDDLDNPARKFCKWDNKLSILITE